MVPSLCPGESDYSGGIIGLFAFRLTARTSRPCQFNLQFLASAAWTIAAANFPLEPGSGLARLYGETGPRRVVSIHHQAIKRLAPDLQVEARAEDGVIEAVRGAGASYICAVQWHPEFHGGRAGFLDGGPLLDEFLQAARA